MIKPLENKKNNKIKIKVFFLLSLFIFGIIFSLYFKNNKKTEIKKNNSIKEVLGEKTEIKKIENEAKKYKEEVLNEINNFYQKTQQKSSELISSFIYDATIKPIVNQINRLPKDQKEKIKEEICNH